jgi:hypothetical protein
MNIENDFLTDFDLFGKSPELYYKGRSKKSSLLGIILTVIYIVIYIAFLIYKLVRMFKRVDVTFYDSYVFQGIPSIKLTNNEFYGALGMFGGYDPAFVRIEVHYVRKEKINGNLETIEDIPLELEQCRQEWFGSEYQHIIKNEGVERYLCIKNVDGLVLEGYSNMERYSYLNTKFYACIGQEGCAPLEYVKQYFQMNYVELKVQDNDLNPEDYEHPVIRRVVDMNSPVFSDLFQLIYSYIQIVNIETDEDITGLNFFTDHIRKETYTRYEESFLIASPSFYGDPLTNPYAPIADVTLQLHGKVLTEKRQYTQLIDVLGDVGGLMEILLTVLNLISSFFTEVLYDQSIVNELFSFDLNKKLIILNVRHKKNEKNANYEKKFVRDERDLDKIRIRKNFKDLEENNNIEIYQKEKLDNNINNNGESNDIIISNNNTISHKKKKKKRTAPSRIANARNSRSIIKLSNEKIENEINAEKKLPVENIENTLKDENTNQNIENKKNNYLNLSTEQNLKNVYINTWLICCFWLTSKKRNINKVLFEEGSLMLTQRLDILNLFNNVYISEILQKKMGVEARDADMTDGCKSYINFIHEQSKGLGNSYQ